MYLTCLCVVRRTVSECLFFFFFSQGCASWKWYFPFHYAPFASDFKDIKGMFSDFEKGTKPVIWNALHGHTNSVMRDFALWFDLSLFLMCWLDLHVIIILHCSSNLWSSSWVYFLLPVETFCRRHGELWWLTQWVADLPLMTYTWNCIHSALNFRNVHWKNLV